MTGDLIHSGIWPMLLRGSCRLVRLMILFYLCKGQLKYTKQKRVSIYKLAVINFVTEY